MSPPSMTEKLDEMMDKIEMLTERERQQGSFPCPPRSWPEAVSVLTIICLFVGSISWGVKLENKVDSVINQIDRISVLIDRGILPITEERLKSMAGRIDLLCASVEDLRSQIQGSIKPGKTGKDR